MLILVLGMCAASRKGKSMKKQLFSLMCVYTCLRVKGERERGSISSRCKVEDWEYIGSICTYMASMFALMPGPRQVWSTVACLGLDNSS